MTVLSANAIEHCALGEIPTLLVSKSEGNCVYNLMSMIFSEKSFDRKCIQRRLSQEKQFLTLIPGNSVVWFVSLNRNLSLQRYQIQGPIVNRWMSQVQKYLIMPWTFDVFRDLFNVFTISPISLSILTLFAALVLKSKKFRSLISTPQVGVPPSFF